MKSCISYSYSLLYSFVQQWTAFHFLSLSRFFYFIFWNNILNIYIRIRWNENGKWCGIVWRAFTTHLFHLYITRNGIVSWLYVFFCFFTFFASCSAFIMLANFIINCGWIYINLVGGYQINHLVCELTTNGRELKSWDNLDFSDFFFTSSFSCGI